MTRANDLPTREFLLDNLSYEPESGLLTWKSRDRSRFETNRGFATWNARYAGKEAGTLNDQGYILVSFKGDGFGRFRAHRIIWKMVYGYDPEYIDHANHKTDDNRIENLRDVSQKENRMNVSKQTRKSDGLAGIRKRSGCYSFSARVMNKSKTFYSLQDAIDYRDSEWKRLGFHENHGASL